MKNTTMTTENNLATSSKSRGRVRSKKTILLSIIGILLLLGIFFIVEKQTNLISLFGNDDDSETEEQDILQRDVTDFGSSEKEDKLKNKGDLALSNLSFEQYVLATAFIEEELTYREPESNYFYFDNTSLNNEPADSTHEYATLSFEIVSSNQKKYKIVIDVNESLSSFEEIHILEQ